MDSLDVNGNQVIDQDEWCAGVSIRVCPCAHSPVRALLPLPPCHWTSLLRAPMSIKDGLREELVCLHAYTTTNLNPKLEP